MNTCTACKNKSSNDRCKSISVKGLAFCGVHARSKAPRIWSVVNNINAYVNLISKVWRGYRIRRLLKLAGPGVLKRSLCHNDEELVLLEDRRSVLPLDYFAFEEASRVWWFDIRSMIGCLNASLVPSNPYTRQVLSMDTRFRLRLLYKYRIQNKLPTLHEVNPKRSLSELTQYQWMRVCQILHENGFEDYTPNMFLSISSNAALFYFLIFMRAEIYNLARSHNKSSKYYKFSTILKREIETFRLTQNPSIRVATTLMILLNDLEDAFHVCAAIARSVARL